MFRNLRMRWELRRGRALDIWSTGEYPSDVLSNLCSNRFRLDGIECQSMEGFLQSLKYEDSNRQRQICSMKGRNAKRQSTTTWQTDQVVWWRGRAIDRQGTEYQDLLRRAYQAMFNKNDRFRAALMASRGRILYHSHGNIDPFKTILTQEEFCSILMEIREAYDQRDKALPQARKIVLVDVGLMNFAPDLESLSGKYDCYWVTTGDCDFNSDRLVRVPSLDLCKGDILIYLKDSLDPEGFEGECLEIESDSYQTWQDVL